MKKQEGEEGLHFFCPVLVLQDLKDGLTRTDEGRLAVEEGAPEDVMQDVVIYVLTTTAVAFSKVELLEVVGTKAMVCDYLGQLVIVYTSVDLNFWEDVKRKSSFRIVVLPAVLPLSEEEVPN
ncbi:hypothetical protein AVEN_33771-1 [Araneus ventricosus]|uniref:Uncharacterized protein n=1 Tax=Araneus ventricosus TaxID=182803 RepID=A0A4Y2RAW7_ARAVE|nr:hypothetical protein AVEN_33771-1 [Araneus ventricosus]